MCEDASFLGPGWLQEWGNDEMMIVSGFCAAPRPYESVDSKSRWVEAFRSSTASAYLIPQNFS